MNETVGVASPSQDATRLNQRWINERDSGVFWGFDQRERDHIWLELMTVNLACVDSFHGGCVDRQECCHLCNLVFKPEASG